MSDVFLSYKRSEAALVIPLRDKLIGLRLNVFFDTDALDSGDHWARKIDREAKAARCVLACWSRAALHSEWVYNECTEGWREDRRRLVVARIGEFNADDVPVEFNRVHFEDLTAYAGEDEHAGFIKLLEPIGRFVGRPGLADFQRYIAAGDLDAMERWVLRYPLDPLANDALMLAAAARKKRVDAKLAAPAPAPVPVAAPVPAPQPPRTPESDAAAKRPRLKLDPT